jgi:hypothetical protein
MDDFRRLDDFADSTDDPFGSPLGRPARATGREPSPSAAKVWHRMVGVLLALGIGGGSVALLLSILIVNLLPVVLAALLLLLASAVIAFRFRRSSPDLTAMRLIWRVTPTVGMLYGIALGVSFASGSSQLDTITIIVLAGFGATAGMFCATGAALSITATRYVKRRHDARIGGAAELVPIAVGSLVGAAIVMVWLVSTGRYLLPAYLAFGPTVTVLLVGALLLRSWQRWQRSRRDAQTAR